MRIVMIVPVRLGTVYVGRAKELVDDVVANRGCEDEVGKLSITRPLAMMMETALWSLKATGSLTAVRARALLANLSKSSPLRIPLSVSYLIVPLNRPGAGQLTSPVKKQMTKQRATPGWSMLCAQSWHLRTSTFEWGIFRTLLLAWTTAPARLGGLDSLDPPDF